MTRSFLSKFFLIIFALEGLYVAGTYLFLNSNYLRQELNADPSSLSFDYRRAWSPFPGHLYVSDFTMRLQDRNVQFFYKLDRASVGVRLSPLLHKRFQTRFVQGDGLAFFFRMRRQGERVSPSERRGLPEIPDLSLTSPLPPKQPNAAKKNDGWRATLEGIRITRITELWFEALHFKGIAEVRGGFWIRPGESAQIFPSEVHFLSGEINHGEQIIADSVGGTIHARIDRFLSDKIPGWTIFRYISGEIQTHARLTQGMSFLNYYLRKTPWLNLDPKAQGKGKFDANIIVDRGRFCRGSRLKIIASPLFLRAHDTNVRGTGNVDWRVIADKADRDLSQLTLGFDRFQVNAPTSKKAQISGRQFDITVTSPDLQLPDAFKRLNVGLDLPRVSVWDLSYFNSFIPKGAGIKITGGHGYVWGHLSSRSDISGEDAGQVGLKITNASARYDQIEFKGDVSAFIPLKKGNSEKLRFDVSSASVHIDHATPLYSGKRNKDAGSWWGTVTVPRGVLQLNQPQQFTGKVNLVGRDARPLISTFVIKNDLPKVLQSILSFENLSASTQVKLGSDLLSLKNATASGDHTHLRGWLSRTKHKKEGKLLLEYGPFALGLNINGSSTDVQLMDPVRWFNKALKKKDRESSR